MICVCVCVCVCKRLEVEIFMHWCIFKDNLFACCILTSATVFHLQWPDGPIQPQTPDNGHGGSQHRAEGKNPAVDQREEVQVLVSIQLSPAEESGTVVSRLWHERLVCFAAAAVLWLFQDKSYFFNRVLFTRSVNFGVCWQKSRSTSSVTFLADVGWLVFWLVIHAMENDPCSSVTKLTSALSWRPQDLSSFTVQ